MFIEFLEESHHIILHKFLRELTKCHKIIVRPSSALSPLHPNKAPKTSSSGNNSSKLRTSKVSSVSNCNSDKEVRQSPGLDNRDRKALTSPSLISFSSESQTTSLISKRNFVTENIKKMCLRTIFKNYFQKLFFKTVSKNTSHLGPHFFSLKLLHLSK